MTNKIFVENVRKIAKTDEILKKFSNTPAEQDKGKILSNRGVGFADTPYTPCQLLYASTDGVYTFANLVDGVAGPKIQDGNYNHCDQVNTITGMRETGVSPTLTLRLKPDGIFLPSTASEGYLYTSDSLLSKYQSDSSIQVFHSSLQDALDYILAVSLGDWPTLVIDTPIPVTVLSSDIGSYNWLPENPVYLIQDVDIAPSVTFYDVVYGVPTNYDSTIDSISSGDPVQRYEVPGLFVFKSAGVAWQLVPSPYVGMNQYASEPVLGVTNSFQLAIDIGNTNLWKPDPTETTAPVKYTNGVSIVSFDFGTSYARKGLVHPAKDGGFAIYETSSGTPINNAYIYRRDRTLAVVVPIAQMTPYLV